MQSPFQDSKSPQSPRNLPHPQKKKKLHVSFRRIVEWLEKVEASLQLFIVFWTYFFLVFLLLLWTSKC